VRFSRTSRLVAICVTSSAGSRITVNSCRDLQRRRRFWLPLTLVRTYPASALIHQSGGRLMHGLKKLTLNEGPLSWGVEELDV
jgi:hypothetical protein